MRALPMHKPAPGRRDAHSLPAQQQRTHGCLKRPAAWHLPVRVLASGPQAPPRQRQQSTAPLRQKCSSPGLAKPPGVASNIAGFRRHKQLQKEPKVTLDVPSRAAKPPGGTTDVRRPGTSKESAQANKEMRRPGTTKESVQNNKDVKRPGTTKENVQAVRAGSAAYA